MGQYIRFLVLAPVLQSPQPQPCVVFRFYRFCFCGQPYLLFEPFEQQVKLINNKFSRSLNFNPYELIEEFFSCVRVEWLYLLWQKKNMGESWKSYYDLVPIHFSFLFNFMSKMMWFLFIESYVFVLLRCKLWKRFKKNDIYAYLLTGGWTQKMCAHFSHLPIVIVRNNWRLYLVHFQ